MIYRLEQVQLCCRNSIIILTHSLHNWHLPEILFENTVLDSTRTEKKHQTDVVFILSDVSGYFLVNKRKESECHRIY